MLNHVKICVCRRTDWLGVVFIALHCVSFVTAQSLAKYNLTRPLRICTASIQDFGARCNGAPDAAFEHNEAPNGPVPAGGWCAAGEDFCGYDIDVWRYAHYIIVLSSMRINCHHPTGPVGVVLVAFSM